MKSGTKFSISINSDSAWDISVIAHLAEVELSEGKRIADPEFIYAFLDMIEHGVEIDRESGYSFIMGNGETEGWESVANICKRIAEKIEKNLSE